MKTFIYTVLAVLTAIAVWVWIKSQPKSTLQTRAQKDAQNNGVLDSYSVGVNPIAQLARVPWTQANLRMVDPFIPPPVALPLIPNNGGF